MKLPPAIPPTKKYRMMNHSQWGDAVKNVSGIRPPLPGRRHLFHPAVAEPGQPQQGQGDRPESREQRAADQVATRQLGIPRQTVDLGLVHDQVKGVEPAEHVLVRAVEPGTLLAEAVQLRNPGGRPLLELANRAELDRLGGTRLGAGRHHADLQPVVTQGALLGGPRDRVYIDHPKRTGGDAVATAVAGVGLDDDRVELGPDDCAGGADLEATRVRAVFAHVAHHEPASAFAVFGELLDELHVAPVNPVEPLGVVVAVAAHLMTAAIGRRQLVPLLARDLAGLAADADDGVGVETHRLRHQAFSTLQTKALPSWMVTFGSATIEVSSFTTSPVTTPSQPQCQGMPTWWITRPPMRNGRSRRVTRAFARIEARGVVIRTQSVLPIPFSPASSGLSSMNSSGISSVSQGFHRLMAPAR